MLYVLAAITLGFLVLTAFVFFFPSPLLDREFSAEVQEHQNPLLDALMKAISWFGYIPVAPVMVLSTALLFFIFKYKREALFLILTMISSLVSTVVKLLVDRPRPSDIYVRIIGKNLQASFPSGHVLFYVVFFGFLTLLMYRLKAIRKIIRILVSIVCLFLIFTIPVSRIYLGAHWFTDVLAGFLLGILCLAAIIFFYLKSDKRPGMKNNSDKRYPKQVYHL